jgi:O-antigen ligase
LGLAGARTVGTFGNAAVFTTTLVFLALFLLQHNMQARSTPLVRLAYWLAIGLAMFMVFFSFSRGSWLGGVVVLLGWVIIYPRPILRVATVVMLLALVLGSGVLAQQVAFAVERLNTVETAESRLVQDAASLRMIEERPAFGWGYDNYLRFNREFVGRVGDSIAVSRATTSHNTYLTLTVEFGLVGISLYMFGAVAWLWFTLRVRRRMPERGFANWKFVVLLWLLVADHFIVSNFMDMVKYNLFGTTVWWIALGLIANQVYPYLKSNEISTIVRPERRVRYPGALDASRR